MAEDNGRMIDGPKNGSSVGVLLQGPSELIRSRAVSYSREALHSIARLHGNLYVIYLLPFKRQRADLSLFTRWIPIRMEQIHAYVPWTSEEQLVYP